MRVLLFTSLFTLHFLTPAAQFRTTVVGEAVSSVTVFIRNRWPSGETMYCCRLSPCTAPPTRVSRSGTATSGSTTWPIWTPPTSGRAQHVVQEVTAVGQKLWITVTGLLRHESRDRRRFTPGGGDPEGVYGDACQRGIPGFVSLGFRRDASRAEPRQRRRPLIAAPGVARGPARKDTRRSVL